MKNICLYLCLIGIIVSGIAQETFLEVPNDLKKGSRLVKDAYTVVDPETDNFAIFIDDNKTLNGYLYNATLEQIGKIASEGLPNKYNEIIGYTIKDKQIRLFLKNLKGNKYGTLFYDFENGQSEEKEFEFKLKGERYVQTYVAGESFYVVTALKKKSAFNFHIFDHEGQRVTKTVELPSDVFRNDQRLKVPFTSLISQPTQIGAPTGIFALKIDETTPNSLESTSFDTKMYLRDDGFLLTADQSRFLTYVIAFKIPELDVTVTEIKKPFPVNPLASGLKTNSFIQNNTIFQVLSSYDEFSLRISDLHSQEIIKEFKLGRDDSIHFKNTPIIQEGGSFNQDRVREMEKTSKFLRKISTQRNGIAVIPNENGYQITVGGIKELSSGGGFGFGFAFGGLAGGIIVASINPTAFAYNAYTSTVSTRIECLFDKDFNHVSGEITENVFDRIQGFSKTGGTDKLETVFKYQGDFIHGKYNSKSESFILTLFQE